MSDGVTPATARLMADADAMDARAFAAHLTDDCVLRFGNAAEVRGREAIRQALAGFLTTINGLHHRVVHEHLAGATTVVEALVTYTRHDDARVTVPVVTVYRRARESNGIDAYRVYFDLAPVYG